MEKTGYIKLHRKMLDWEWYDDYSTFRLFIHLLLKVNHKDQKWKGQVIKRGSCVTSRAKLAQETGLSEQNIKTALKHLLSTNEITKQGTSKNTIITVLNYDLYQSSNQVDNQQNNQQVTNDQPTPNQQVTTNKNEKNDKNDKNILSSTNSACAREYELSLLEIFENEFGRPLSAIEIESLLSMQNRHSQELVLKALKEAVLNNSKSFRYIEAILENWKSAGIRTVDEAQKQIDAFKQRKSSGTNKTYPAKEKQLPSWYYDQESVPSNLEEFDEQELIQQMKALRGET